MRSIRTLRPEVDDAPSKAACLAAFADRCSPGVTECYRCGPDAFDECLSDPAPADEDHPSGGGCWWCYRCQAAMNTTELPIAGGAIAPPEEGGYNVSGAMAAPSLTPVGANVSEQDWNWSPRSLAGGQELDTASSSSDAAPPPGQQDELLGQTPPAGVSASASATALLSTAPTLYSGSVGGCYAKADRYCGVGVQRSCFQCHDTSGGLVQLVQAQSSTDPRRWDEGKQAYVPPLTTAPIGGPPTEGRFYWCFSCVGEYAFTADSSVAPNTAAAATFNATTAAPRFGVQTRLLTGRSRPLPLAPLPWAPAVARPQAEWTMSPNPLQLVCAAYVLLALRWFAHAFGLDEALAFAVQDPSGASKAARDQLAGLFYSIFYTLKCGWLPGGCSELPRVARSGGTPGPFSGDRSLQLRNENSAGGEKGAKSTKGE